MILAGYCPIKNSSRVFKFSCDTSTFPIRPFYNEILTPNGIEFFGSGKIEADIISKGNTNLSPLHIIRQVIKDGKIISVGGGLQYGDFVINNFTISGVEDYVLNDDGSFNEYLYTLRGINYTKTNLKDVTKGFTLHIHSKDHL